MDPASSPPLESLVFPSKIQPHIHLKHLYQQTYGSTSIPVLFGYYHVVKNLKTNLITTIDNFKTVNPDVSTEPIQSIAAAKEAALRAWCPEQTCLYTNMQVSLCMWPSPTVVCYNVTFVPVKRFFGASMTYIVNGDNLDILAALDGRHRFTATANSLYNGQVSVSVSSYSSTYYLEDTGRKQGFLDCSYTNCTTELRLSYPNTRWTVYNNSVSAAYGAGKAFDYFSQQFSRNGIDGSGGPGLMTSADGRTRLFPHMVDYELNFNDAMYTPEGIVYGAGDGINFTQLVSVDFIGHEFMHGIISYVLGPNLGFVYANQSGALEEAYCDVFGAMVERYTIGESNRTWMIGEDFYTPNISGDALRYLDYPHNATNMGYTIDDNPDYYTQMYNGTLDNGGVHVNCGIPSKVFYLLAKGGQHELGGPNMTGIQPDEAASIWWHALTTYLTPSAQFADARSAHIYAARDLYGAESFQLNEVETAWAVCGVGSLPPPFVAQIAVNPSFETVNSPWVFAGSNNCSVYVQSGTYAHTGYGYAMLGLINSASGTLTQSPITITTHAVSANLTFWMEISTIETSPYADVVTLFVKNVNTGFSTVLDQYFNSAAGPYSMRGPYNMIAYAGIPITIEFQISTSATLPTTFFIDDVQMSVGYY